ncbi:pyridoxal phosphate-dependent transferase [Chaetomidium leptoderma]|uniref:Pyridoxal phosphate-dependent transferase n=1 Tax=Chaetomidium leptoderma TaxID=669021 RepID=A0AAN6ZYA9_9PEZI|nr:pyridoxal phosphate-dependent transferase [Chaetomidium leptoderma]
MPLILPPARSLLWRSLRAYQVYGANTDVGKTVVTTILCKAAHRRWRNEDTVFLKPVSTGPADDADDRHIQKFGPEIATKTLFQYDLAVSPHIAAPASNKPVPSDETLLAEISIFAARQASRGPGWLFVETAGGVHSPSPSGSTQADLYMPLRLPVLLVGDSKLGGISQTISAFESLKIRGYDVEMVLLFQEADYQNHLYLGDYFGQRHGIPVRTVPEPPKRPDDQGSDVLAMSRYYNNSSQSAELHDMLGYLDDRHTDRISRLESMSSKASKKIWYPFTQQKHLTPDKIAVIDSARGDYFQTLVTTTPAVQDPAASTTTTSPNNKALLRPSFDGSASWWTQGLGHGNPNLVLAAAYAAGRYGHVMFAEAVHEPALALAETLLARMGNPRLTRTFFSDNGSTGTEVAVKMALRAARLRYGWDASEPLGVLGLQGSYHGDTIGAMDCSPPCVFNEKVEWYEGKGFWFDYPVVEYSGGTWMVRDPVTGRGRYSYPSLSAIFDLESRASSEEAQMYEHQIRTTLVRLAEQGRKFGALIIEPVVLGAGGMLLVDPLFQNTLVKVVRQNPQLFSKATARTNTPAEDDRAWTGLPVVFDEVFTGLYRLGRFSAASFLGVDADISVHAKLLTGGLVPLSVTLASESIFQAFESDDKSDALLHGHSYTAHPVGCQVALESLKEMQGIEARGDWDWAREAHKQSEGTPKDAAAWSVWSPELIDWVGRLPSSCVAGVWALGTVLAIRMASADGTQGYKGGAARGVQATLLEGHSHEGDSDWANVPQWNVHTRVLGNTLYIMAGLKSTQGSIKGVESQLHTALLKAKNESHA